MKLADILAQCSEQYNLALREAKTIGKGCYRSRGRFIRVFRGIEMIAGEAETWPWDGTLRELKKAVSMIGEGNSGSVMIDGGIDYGENLNAFEEGWYEPLVADWSLTVYEKNVY